MRGSRTRRKSETKYKIRRIGAVVIAIVILVLAIILASKIISKPPVDNNTKQVAAKNVNSEPEEKTSSFTMAMVGDHLIHSSVYKDAARLAGGNGYDFTPMLTYVKERVEGFDLKYYNQETILGGTELGLSDYPSFNSPYEAGDAMLDAGFNLVSLATNHTMDRGTQAVLNSRAYWDEQKDVLAVGSYDSFERQEEVVIKEINGITYTMLNYTYGTNGIAVPEGKEYLVNVWPTNLNINDPDADTAYNDYKQRVAEDIKKVRNKVDFLIVAMHWGVEYTHEPTAYEKDSAKFLADQGVNLIIGTHPHVIQPVEWIDNTLVYYSLGNFLSSQYQDQNFNKSVGLMGTLRVTKTEKGDEKKITIDNIENELLYAYYNTSTWRDFHIIPFSHPDIANYMKNYESVYETYKDVVQKYDETMKVTPLAE